MPVVKHANSEYTCIDDRKESLREKIMVGSPIRMRLRCCV